ncbi:MAG: RlmE family RNA methyltransferase [Candidatus Peribacteria bacterium]|jgi:23S rRNA (uridine2552-2'-O)-methyltransferase|nr:RlmE family RNA methyltransferase [Candidatus Peribacteria bacterium]
MYNPYDFYFKKAKKKGYKARSAFKLEEIQDKFHLITKDTKNVIDIGCAPGSWMQYTVAQLQKMHVKNYQVIGFDLKKVEITLPGMFTYAQDVTEQDKVNEILASHQVGEAQVDFIQSDMAPNTIGDKEIDAVRSIALLEETMWMYEKYLKPEGKFCTKIFMGPGFDEYVAQMKKLFGGKNIKVFKPVSCRKESKETYVIKV